MHRVPAVLEAELAVEHKSNLLIQSNKGVMQNA